eukprot:660081-Rhodomonas_salina.1
MEPGPAFPPQPSLFCPLSPRLSTPTLPLLPPIPATYTLCQDRNLEEETERRKRKKERKKGEKEKKKRKEKGETG